MKPRLTRLALVAGVLTLTACTTLGPDYQRPSADWLEGWDPSPHDLFVAGETGTELAFWWTMFDDPVLDRLIRTAGENNRQLRLAALRIFESRALLGIAGSQLYPQLQQLGGSVNWVQTWDHENPDSIRSGSLIGTSLGLNAAWELDFWGRFRRGIESADAAFLAAVETQRAMQVLVNAQVVTAYFSYRVTQARIGIARKNAEIQKRSFEVAQALFHSGNTSELDLQQARTQYLSTLTTISQLEMALVQARNALAVLLGRAPGALAGLESGDYRLPRLAQRRVTAIPSRLLLRRPDVRAAAWAVAAQSAQIGIAEADFYPAISLLGSLGWSGTSRGDAGATTLAIGPGLRWNIFDHGRIANNVRLQDARLQQAIEQYQQTVLEAAAEVDDAAIAVVKTAEQVRLLEETVKTAERALAIANTSYHEGYTDFQRVLDAQRSLFAQNDRLVSVQGDHLAAVVGLYKGLGGGWSPQPVERLLPPETVREMKRRVDWGGLLEQPLRPVAHDEPNEETE